MCNLIKVTNIAWPDIYICQCLSLKCNQQKFGLDHRFIHRNKQIKRVIISDMEY